jgi:hypothetical protein
MFSSKRKCIATPSSSTSVAAETWTGGGDADTDDVVVTTPPGSPPNSKKQKQQQNQQQQHKKVEVASGIYLQGRELEEFCQQKGRCPLCAKTRVKKKILHIFGSNTWESITVKVKVIKVDDDGRRTEHGGGGGLRRNKKQKGNKDSTSNNNVNVKYTVYKGYCVQDGCFTLEQAKRLADGDNCSSAAADGTTGSGRRLSGINSFGSSGRRFRHTSIASANSAGNTADGYSIVPSVELKQKFLHQFLNNNNNNNNNTAQHQQQQQEQEQPIMIREVIDHTILSLQRDCGGGMRKIKIIDLSGYHLRMLEMNALSDTLKAIGGGNGNGNGSYGGGTNLQDLVFNNCSINNEILKVLADALVGTSSTLQLKGLYLSDNEICNQGIDELCPFFEKSTTLETLDLSRNDIETMGGISIFNSFRRAQQTKTKIKSIDLSFNLLRRLSTLLTSTSDNESVNENENHNKLFGIYGFLSRNASLLQLNLSGNKINDTSIEHICNGLKVAGTTSNLQRLCLGFNCIGDRGAIAIGSLLLTNNVSSLQYIELNENIIGNDGGMAILNGMGGGNGDNGGNDDGTNTVHHNLKEIKGLWENNINRRYIIVSIRKLLLLNTNENDDDDDGGGGTMTGVVDRNGNTIGDHCIQGEEHAAVAAAKQAMREATSSTMASTTTTTNEFAPDVEEHLSDLSEDEEYDDVNDDLIDRRTKNDQYNDKNELSSVATSVARLLQLEATGEDVVDKDLLPDYNDNDNDNDNDDDYLLDFGGGCDMMETNQEVTYNFDRMTILNSTPLVYLDDKEMMGGEINYKAIPLYDTKYEMKTIEKAVAVAITRGSQIEICCGGGGGGGGGCDGNNNNNNSNDHHHRQQHQQQTAATTVDTFYSFFSRKDSPVLHFSCYGSEHNIILENGYGSIQSLSFDSLKRLVSTIGPILQLVFISSTHSLPIGQAFIDAGVPHVVCCHREGNKFRDPIAIEFIQCFYRQAAKKKTLSEAFGTAVQAVISSPLSKNLRQVNKRFHLLPSGCMEAYHDTPVFFNNMAPVITKDDDENYNNNFDKEQMKQPHLSDNFIGREVDIYEILESLQVDDLIKISGTPGYGKDNVVTAVVEYALQRRDTFSIDYAYWIPALSEQQQKYDVVVEPDSVYGDLILCSNLIRTSNEDIWDANNETLFEACARLEIELEDMPMIVVVDDRSFSSKGSQAALNKFINFILTNGAAAKVIRISTTRTTTGNNGISNSSIEQSHIELDTLGFRSTALLYGEVSKHISSNMCTAARSANEFADLMEPPFVSQIKDLSVVGSQRRADIFGRMGNGLPSEVIAAAESMNLKKFEELIKIASKPEIHVDSTSGLESEILRWTLFKEQALKDRNYKRALDLHAMIEDLEGMRFQFPSLKDLKEEEHLMKSDLSDAVSNRRYDVANELKRELLALKKKIMKERRISTNRLSETPKHMLTDLQAQVDSLIEKNVHNESLEDDDNETKTDKIKSFDVDCDGRNCSFFIYSGSIFNVKSRTIRYNNVSKGIVCWSNEACDLEKTADGSLLSSLGGEQLQDDVAKLPIVEDTLYGPVRCVTGKSLILSSGPSTRIKDNTIILSVGPYGSPSGQIDAMLEGDEDYLHYGKTTLRSCYRSCVGRANKAGLRVMAISPLTTRTKNGLIYEEMIQIGLQTLSEEVKFSQLEEVHIIARSSKEATIMVDTMQSLGYYTLEQHGV